MNLIDYYEICKAKLKYLRYSERTIPMYLFYIKQFLESVNVAPSRLNAEHFQKYLESYQFTSGSQQNQVINAIRFLYKFGLDRKYEKVSFKRPRKERKLPRVINHNELFEKINSIPNLKHKAILSLAYCCGLRVSEVVNLKISDIDGKQRIILISQAKGKKDRMVPVSENVLATLREYFKAYRPKEYLFNGQFTTKYSVSSCQQIFKKYIDKKHSFHHLRHSAYTTMLEKGVDLRVIQTVAGHKSPNTTAIYTHVSSKFLQSIQTPI